MHRRIEHRSPCQPQLYGEVNTTHYVKDPTTQVDAAGVGVQGLVPNPRNRAAFDVTEVLPWGSVFGIRKDNGEWEFSLQETGTVFYNLVLGGGTYRRIREPL